MRAERLFEALEFDSAAEGFEAALREPGSRDERLRAWKGLALSKAFMGQARQAQADFEELLALDPDVEVSRSLGPKIRKPFEAARKKMRGTPRAALKVVRRQDGQVEAVLENPLEKVVKVAVYVRQPGESSFQATESDSPGPVVPENSGNSSDFPSGSLSEADLSAMVVPYAARSRSTTSLRWAS